MHRSSMVLLVAAVLLGTVLTGSGTLVAAQDIDPTTHPLVGSWILDGDPENPANLPELVTIFADGTMILSAPGGTTGHGAWAPTDATTANATLLLVFENGNRTLVRFNLQVAEDEETFSAFYTNEFFNAANESSGEIGPRVAQGTRIGVAGPGTPVTSFEEFSREEFFGGAEQAPEATPAS